MFVFFRFLADGPCVFETDQESGSVTFEVSSGSGAANSRGTTWEATPMMLKIRWMSVKIWGFSEMVVIIPK